MDQIPFKSKGLGKGVPILPRSSTSLKLKPSRVVGGYLFDNQRHQVQNSFQLPITENRKHKNAYSNEMDLNRKENFEQHPSRKMNQLGSRPEKPGMEPVDLDAKSSGVGTLCPFTPTIGFSTNIGNSQPHEVYESPKMLTNAIAISRQESSSRNQEHSNDDKSLGKKLKKFITKSVSAKIDLRFKEMGTNKNTGLQAMMESIKLVIAPDSQYDTMVGHDAVKDAIENAFISYNCVDEDIDAQMYIRSILLCGMPGCGKTDLMLNTAAQIANLIKKPVSVFVISAADILSKYVGESEKAVRALWDTVERNSPSLVLFDEVDSLMKARNNEESEHCRRLKNELLSQMEGVRKMRNVVTLAATNRGQDLDDAFLRRFKRKFLLRPPTGQQRIQILEKFLNKSSSSKHLRLSGKDSDQFIERTHNFTGDDIKTVVSLALSSNIRVKFNERFYETRRLNDIRRDLERRTHPPTAIRETLSVDALFHAVERVKPSCNAVDIRNLDRWAQKRCDDSSFETVNPLAIKDRSTLRNWGLSTLLNLL